MQYKDVLDELTVRFLMNLPKQDYESVERLFFILEEVHWYYIDFMADDNKTFRTFVIDILSHINYTQVEIDQCLKAFGEYKYDVPVYGALIFNAQMDHILLNKGCSKRAQFLFPRGKKFMNETGAQCAIREVYEEIGYDISDKISKVAIRPSGERYTLYLIFNVPVNTRFECQTRNEIAAIRWVSVRDIMGKGANDLKQVRNVYFKIKDRIDRIRTNRFSFDRKAVLREFDRVITSI
ncbi:Decapping enzyme complex, predicted pyrophosphatase DCP2 [Trachipleistophora hominis]|uniref:Decapping enzyme complex, predicted pyrophosphatase DCP2 n=1 Tax=Trachipleistophora hominis TaxID=72359 RepID=L7JU98_TRAHO|nr:Decapping enzyme complex, predicted pyrophosphatase DCP2 [Trachipleistophora hominis]